MRNLHLVAFLVGGLVACGDDTSSGGGGSGGSTATANGGSTGDLGGQAPGGSNPGGSNPGGSSPGGGDVGGAGGAGPALVNGCDISTAEDMTDQDTVDITWSLPSQQCLIVAAGTVVTWTGNFTLHPLVGGIVPATDNASPITGTDQTGASTSVTFDAAGDFPYHCNVHQASMQGVIYVQ